MTNEQRAYERELEELADNAKADREKFDGQAAAWQRHELEVASIEAAYSEAKAQEMRRYIEELKGQ